MRKDIHIHSEAAVVPSRRRLRAVPTPPSAGRGRFGDYLSDLDSRAGAYLTRIAESGRRSMRSRLDRAARIILTGSGVETFPWGDLSYEDVVRVRTRLSMEGLSAATINLTLVALRRVAREARRLKVMTPEAEAAIREVETVRAESVLRGRMLTPGERRHLFAACARDAGARGRRDACIVALLLGAGLRRDECAGLPPEAVEESGRRLRVTGKGGKQTVLPLHAEAARAVCDWLRVRGRCAGPLLAPVSWSGRVRAGLSLSGQDVYRAVLRLAAEAGIPRCTPHDLRRTFISELLDKTDEFTAQRLARHANSSTTGRYDRRGEREAERAVRSLYVPYVRPPSRPRPKRKPHGARRKKGRKRVNKVF